MDIRAALRERFGFEDFRDGQEAAVAAALGGRDVLVVMPTGSGKSLCYQLPALLREDLSLVVSPLVSLMQDQVEGLAAVAGPRVGLVNAQRSAAQNEATIARARAGELSLLYVAPERFAARGFVTALEDVPIGLFVVDEAHCVSQWGHDFRPDYFRLADAARYIGAQAIVASTATATPRVARDVERRLGLADPARITTGFDRPNLSFAVVPCRAREDKHRRIEAVLAEDGALPAIVYGGTRAGCETLAARLQMHLGEPAIAYHAGLPRDERAAAQRRFMSGDVRVVVATNAFGMGVDKADVRTVCHETVPQSVEAYYQEAGRAGRDGRPARCLLFAEPRDKGLHTFFIERAGIDEQQVRQVATLLERDADRRSPPTLEGLEAPRRYEGDAVAIASAVGTEPDGLRAIVGHLASAGVLQPAPSAPDRVSGRLIAPCDGAALARCRAAINEAQRGRWRQYRAIWKFVEDRSCRRRAMLDHFGDHSTPAPDGPCCDVCDPGLLPAAPAGAGVPSGSRRRAGSGASAAGGVTLPPGDLDDAILDVVVRAEPQVGRTRAVEILRGGRTKEIAKHAYDGLPAYGTFAHLSRLDVLARVDALIEAGRLRSTGGRFPKLARTER